MQRKPGEHQTDYYTSQLKKPVWKFILVKGLSWVVPVMIVMIPLNYLMSEKPIYISIRNLSLQIGVWLLGGLFYGWLIRLFYVRKIRSVPKDLEPTKNGS